MLAPSSPRTRFTGWLLLAACSSLQLGCTRARLLGGGAFSTGDLEGHSGIVAGTDVAIGFGRIPGLAMRRDHPLALHVMGEALLAEQLTDLSWGTGIGYVQHSGSVAGYAHFGTSFHVDRIEGRYSFGNLSPYLELGVATPLDPSNVDESSTLLTFGVGSMVFFNFLAPRDRAVTGYYALKFGLAYDTL